MFILLTLANVVAINTDIPLHVSIGIRAYVLVLMVVGLVFWIPVLRKAQQGR